MYLPISSANPSFQSIRRSIDQAQHRLPRGRIEVHRFESRNSSLYPASEQIPCSDHVVRNGVFTVCKGNFKDIGVIADYYRCTVISLSRYTYYRDRRLAIDHGSSDPRPVDRDQAYKSVLEHVHLTRGGWRALEKARLCKTNKEEARWRRS